MKKYQVTIVNARGRNTNMHTHWTAENMEDAVHQSIKRIEKHYPLDVEDIQTYTFRVVEIDCEPTIFRASYVVPKFIVEAV